MKTLNIIQELRPSIRKSSLFFLVHAVVDGHLYLNGRVKDGPAAIVGTYDEIAKDLHATPRNARRLTTEAVNAGWVTRERRFTGTGYMIHLRPTEKLWAIIPGVFDQADQANYWSGDIPYEREQAAQ